MSAISSRILGCCGVIVLSVSLAHASGTLIPIAPVDGSQTGSTTAYGISDNGNIVGSWEDSNNVTHGFIGTLNSTSYSSFDYPAEGTTLTAARGVNNFGYITGFAMPGTANMQEGFGFEREPNGTFLTITEGSGKNATPLDGIPQQIINTGEFVGQIVDDTTYNISAYTGKRGKFLANVTVPFDSDAVEGRGINNAGTIVGFFSDSNGDTHGFILSGDTTTQVDFPDKKTFATVLEGINNKGIISGTWIDTKFNSHGFIYNTNTNVFQNIKVPGSTFVELFGINDHNLVLGDSSTGAFVYCPHVADNCPTSAGVKVPDSPTIPATSKSVRTLVGIHRPAEETRNPVALAAWKALLARLPKGAPIP